MYNNLVLDGCARNKKTGSCGVIVAISNKMACMKLFDVYDNPPSFEESLLEDFEMLNDVVPKRLFDAAMSRIKELESMHIVHGLLGIIKLKTQAIRKLKQEIRQLKRKCNELEKDVEFSLSFLGRV